MTTKLSPAMRAAMRKLSVHPHSAQFVDIRANTLYALRERGLAESSLSGMLWRLTERGEQWLAS